MSEDILAQNEIIAVKIKVLMPKQVSSGLIVGFFDIYRINFMGNFSIVAIGNDLGNLHLTKSYRDLVDIVKQGGTKYDINQELNIKLKNGIETKLSKDFIGSLMAHIQSKDVGTAENLIKRAIEGILTIEKADVQLDFELISHGEFAEIKIEDDLDKMTFAQKLKVVMDYAQNKMALAEKIVRDNIRDMLLVKIAFSRENAIYGNALLTISVLTKQMIGAVITCAGTKEKYINLVAVSFVDFFEGLRSVHGSLKPDLSLLGPVDKALRQINPQFLIEAALNNKSVEMKNLVARSLNAALAQDMQVRLDFDLVNSLRMELLLFPDKVRAQPEEEEESKESTARGLKVVNADLILSPSKGKNISALKAGDSVQIILDASNPTAMKILKRLNLVENNKIRPMGAIVHSIKHTPKVGYRVYVKIADGILGKADEEQDVRIKMGDPVVEEEMKKARGSLVVGIIAGVLVLLIIAVVLWII